MVLDEEHGEVVVLAEAADERSELADLLVIEPAGGLVEQEQPRPRDQRPRQLHPLLRPVGQRCGGAPVLARARPT